jgi:hypothetical protein
MVVDMFYITGFKRDFPHGKKIEKDVFGGNYSLEFIEQTISPNQSWDSVPVFISAVAAIGKTSSINIINWKNS